ncbi:MAG: AlpA family phage regulatory protein [Pseudomonadota bacterium]
MPEPDLLKLNQVVVITGLSREEIMAKVAAGAFPQPLPQGPWDFRWVKRDIEQWLASTTTAS